MSADEEKKAAPDGQAIYKKQCNMCHFPDKADKKMGPGLKDLLKNKELPLSKKPATAEVVREQIEKGSKAMPAFAKKLSTEEMDALMDYLKTL
jgi:mono/diheme cytochrome c family protein